ncbi:MAG: NAD(P)/FAD-dependent oxidoreductase [Planctomycetota bacterium]
MSSKPRVVIVGAGIGGLSAAWHLAPHADVTVIEQGESPLGEASAQNAGMVRRLVRGAYERELACRTHDRLSSLPTAAGEDWHELAPFRRTGAVVAFQCADEAWREAAEALRRRGVAVAELPPERVASIAPALADSDLTHAFHLPDEGVCDAWSLGMGLLRGAQRNAATLRLGCRVFSLRVERDRLRGVETSDGPIECDHVVLAAGAWSAKLAREAGLRRTLTPRARHLFQSTPHALSTNTHPWCWIEDAGLYLRPEAGGFLMSPCDESDTEVADGPGSRRSPTELQRDELARKLARCCPALSDLGVRNGWIGLRTFTPDRSPLVGPDPELDGLAWLAGLGGFGISCALALGEDLARTIRERRREIAAGR